MSLQPDHTFPAEMSHRNVSSPSEEPRPPFEMQSPDGTDERMTEKLLHNDDIDEQHRSIPTPRAPPSIGIVHLSLITVQIIFGSGAVVGALGVESTNPLAFALIRETCAALLLTCIALCVTRCSVPLPARQHAPRILVLGVCIFGMQAFYIVGIKLTDAVTGSIWQPSAPILTAAFSMTRGLEPRNGYRVCGVLIAFVGCAAMVLLSSTPASSTSSSSSSGVSKFVGNTCFFLGCISTAMYVILSKPVLSVYPSISITAWAYSVAAVVMAPVSLLVASSPTIMSHLCPDCKSPFSIPSTAIFPLIYFIVFVSATNYVLLTWTNKYATGTLVIGYSVLQPVTAALLTLCLLGFGVYVDCASSGAAGQQCLDRPSWSAVIGTIGVFIGLAIVIATEPTQRSAHSISPHVDQQEEDQDGNADLLQGGNADIYDY